ncbi:hypothetical protein BDZ91DRAFT_789298 [Kalaharituber pfeilii]|nr:hypothetical protein BDZ91DRAFT_789298 [Kalaharituber pfeilii]
MRSRLDTTLPGRLNAILPSGLDTTMLSGVPKFTTEVANSAHEDWLRAELQNMSSMPGLSDYAVNFQFWKGTVYDTFEIRDAQPSRPSADVGICYNGNRIPSLVVLSCLEKDYSQSYDEMALWMVNGAGKVQATIILCYSVSLNEEKQRVNLESVDDVDDNVDDDINDDSGGEPDMASLRCVVRMFEYAGRRVRNYCREVMSEALTPSDLDPETAGDNLPSVRVTLRQLMGGLSCPSPELTYDFSLGNLWSMAYGTFEQDIEDNAIDVEEYLESPPLSAVERMNDSSFPDALLTPPGDDDDNDDDGADDDGDTNNEHPDSEPGATSAPGPTTPKRSRLRIRRQQHRAQPLTPPHTPGNRGLHDPSKASASTTETVTTYIPNFDPRGEYHGYFKSPSRHTTTKNNMASPTSTEVSSISSIEFQSQNLPPQNIHVEAKEPESRWPQLIKQVLEQKEKLASSTTVESECKIEEKTHMSISSGNSSTVDSDLDVDTSDTGMSNELQTISPDKKQILPFRPTIPASKQGAPKVSTNQRTITVGSTQFVGSYTEEQTLITTISSGSFTAGPVVYTINSERCTEHQTITPDKEIQVSKPTMPAVKQVAPKLPTIVPKGPIIVPRVSTNQEPITASDAWSVRSTTDEETSIWKPSIEYPSAGRGVHVVDEKQIHMPKTVMPADMQVAPKLPTIVPKGPIVPRVSTNQEPITAGNAWSLQSTTDEETSIWEPSIDYLSAGGSVHMVNSENKKYQLQPLTSDEKQIHMPKTTTFMDKQVAPEVSTIPIIMPKVPANQEPITVANAWSLQSTTDEETSIWKPSNGYPSAGGGVYMVNFEKNKHQLQQITSDEKQIHMPKTTTPADKQVASKVPTIVSKTPIIAPKAPANQEPITAGNARSVRSTTDEETSICKPSCVVPSAGRVVRANNFEKNKPTRPADKQVVPKVPTKDEIIADSERCAGSVNTGIVVKAASAISSRGRDSSPTTRIRAKSPGWEIAANTPILTRFRPPLNFNLTWSSSRWRSYSRTSLQNSSHRCSGFATIAANVVLADSNAPEPLVAQIQTLTTKLDEARSYMKTAVVPKFEFQMECENSVDVEDIELEVTLVVKVRRKIVSVRSKWGLEIR